jgi:hypothetical protein
MGLPALKTGIKEYLKQKSIHIKKRFPFFINFAHKVFHKSNMRRFCGFFIKHHFRFLGGSVTFLVIAAYTGGNKVLPRIVSAFRFRDDMVNCKRDISPSAILAFVHIAPENILARENNFFVRDPYKYKKTNNCRIRDFSRNRVDSSRIFGGNKLRFAEIEHYNRSLNIANAYSFIALV